MHEGRLEELEEYWERLQRVWGMSEQIFRRIIREKIKFPVFYAFKELLLETDRAVAELALWFKFFQICQLV